MAQHRAQYDGVHRLPRHRPVLGSEDVRLAHVAAAGQFHLQCVHAMFGVRVVAGDPAALEAPVAYRAGAAAAAQALYRIDQAWGAAAVVVAADIELRQFAIEQMRDERADRMRVVDHDLRVLRAQPCNLVGKRCVVRVEPARATQRDLRLIRSSAIDIQRLIVEGGERAQTGGVLARIQRCPLGSRLTSMTEREIAVRSVVAPIDCAKS